MTILEDEALAAALAHLPGWKQDGQAIRRIYAFPDFASVMRFVHRVADLAEEFDHHPEFQIEPRQVSLRFWSHDSGGVTSRDLRIASRIDSADA